MRMRVNRFIKWTVFFFFSFCRSVVGTSGLAPSPTFGPLILPVFGKMWEIVFTYFANFEYSRRFSSLHLELAIFREDFSSVASVNVRFSWVFYFVFICCYKLNSPPNEMRTGPGLFFTRGFPDFPNPRFSSRMLVSWIQWGREGKIEAIRYSRRLKIFENFLFTCKLVTIMSPPELVSK